MLGGISLGTLGLTVGSILTITGFVAYFMDNATLNLVGFFYFYSLFKYNWKFVFIFLLE